MSRLRLRSSSALLALCFWTMFLLSGCAHALGYAGQHPGYVKCSGKGAITGSGGAMAGAGVGGGGMNGFALQADCGSGFTFEQGAAPPAAK